MSRRSTTSRSGRRYSLLFLLPPLTGCKPVVENGDYDEQQQLRRKLDECGLITEGKWQVFPDDPVVACLLECFTALENCGQLKDAICAAPGPKFEACRDGCAPSESPQDLPSIYAIDSGDIPACEEGEDAQGCEDIGSHICDNGTQLPLHTVCNGRLECDALIPAEGPVAVGIGDVSDEEDCEPPQLFQCNDGQKTSIYFECNGASDCIDGSDEHDGCAYLICE